MELPVMGCGASISDHCQSWLNLDRAVIVSSSALDPKETGLLIVVVSGGAVSTHVTHTTRR
jgi:hypothetical protein